MDKIINISNNPSLKGMAEIIPSIVFSSPGGLDLKLELILPWWNRDDTENIPKFPLIVFIQGSAWTFPNVWYEIPQLCEFSKKGYAIASLTHRNSLEGHPFPSCIEDIKNGIKFLKANAALYGIDPDRVGIFGTSSGGNLALITGMTIDDDYYKTNENINISDSVKFVVACFPTTDLVELYNDPAFSPEIRDIFTALSANNVNDDFSILKKMSPFYLADQDKKYPPILLAHGTADELIPYNQSLKLYKKLKSNHADVSMVSVKDAPHEGSFWSNEIFRIIEDFITKNI